MEAIFPITHFEERSGIVPKFSDISTLENGKTLKCENRKGELDRSEILQAKSEARIKKDENKCSRKLTVNTFERTKSLDIYIKKSVLTHLNEFVAEIEIVIPKKKSSSISNCILSFEAYT